MITFTDEETGEMRIFYADRASIEEIALTVDYYEMLGYIVDSTRLHR